LSAHPLDDYKLELKYAATVSIDKLEKFKEDDISGVRHRLCGIITDVQHRTNQKGEGFGIIKLQDYFGSITIRLFKEQYLQYKGLLNNGVAVMVEGSYEKSTWKQNEDEWVFKVTNMILLSSALEHIVKKFMVYVRLDSISDELIQKIDALVKKNKGNLLLKLQLVDIANEQQLAMVATKKVSVSSELLMELEELGLNYKLN
jgi:DNA polymerase-3 subunit alpha